MLASRMGSLVESIGQEDVLFDRGVADTLIFADANHELGKINDLDYKVYKDYFNSCVAPTIFDSKNKLYDAFVYLRVSDETSIEHIRRRGNLVEQQVDVNY
jgi:deoxyadenosine/deoxycytidine kinase